ncbi:MAG: thioredoxin family protein [Oscillospiraceae bacterium]|nr:thioredoxin family protein [Oscillospiraceae bacterium]
MAAIDASNKTFDALINTDFAVADFHAYHCGGCVALAPFYNAQSNDLPLINYIKVNTDDYPEIAERHQVTGLPTLIYFRNGREVFREGGYMERDRLDQNIARLLYGKEEEHG